LADDPTNGEEAVPEQSEFIYKHEDMLQNLEAAIIAVDRDRHAMGVSDWNVENTLDALISHYVDEIREREPRPRRLDKVEQEIYDRVRSVAEWRLGRREQPQVRGMNPPSSANPLALSEMIECLRALRRSVAHWHKHEGRRGYLEYVGSYFR
jgi:hypothetical protein